MILGLPMNLLAVLFLFLLTSKLVKVPIYINNKELVQGGIWLAEIIFQSKMDAQRFYNHLLKCLQNYSVNQHILLLEDRYIVKIIEGGLPNQTFEKVKEAFWEFIINIKRDDWYREILNNQYYFDDPDEQQPRDQHRYQ